MLIFVQRFTAILALVKHWYNIVFELVKTESGTRLIDSETGQQFGEYFQRLCWSPEWKAALIVHEKYKRNFDLDYDDLRDLRDHVVEYSKNRQTLGKRVNKDSLTQEASKKIKEINENRRIDAKRQEHGLQTT